MTENRMKKCIYCKAEISDESIIDFCQKCGIGVFGEKMFEAIVKNMENARDKRDLYQGCINAVKPENNQENKIERF